MRISHLFFLMSTSCLCVTGSFLEQIYFFLVCSFFFCLLETFELIVDIHGTVCVDDFQFTVEGPLCCGKGKKKMCNYFIFS